MRRATLFLALAACGGGGHHKSSTPSGDVAVVRDDKHLPEALTAPDVVAPPPTGARDSALLVAAGEPPRLMALTCFVAGSKQFLSGDHCFERIGEHGELRLDSGGVVTGDTLVPVDACTTGAGDKARGLEVNGQALAEGNLAIWPKDGPRMEVAGGLTWSPTPEELTNLRAAMHSVAELDGQLEVRQTFTRDLDGDGKPDGVYAVLLHSDSAAVAQPYLATVLIQYSTSTGKLIALEPTRSDEDPKLTVLGTGDLDGDGKRELVVRYSWHEKHFYHLDRVGEAGPERIGEVSCGAEP